MTLLGPALGVVGACTLDSTGTGENLNSMAGTGNGGSSGSAAGSTAAGQGGTSANGGSSSGAGPGMGGSAGSSVGATGGQGGSGATAGEGGTSASGGSGVSGGAGGTGGSSGMGGTGGVVFGPETDCLNGVDDNGDGRTDCEDPQCQPDFECVDEAPSGWQGYYRVRTQPWADPEPAMDECNTSGAMPERVYSGSVAGECSACSCGAHAGGSCNPRPIECWVGNNGCQGTSEDWTDLLASCQNRPGGDKELSCSVGTPTVADPGGCMPSTSVIENTGELFQEVVDRCKAPPQVGGGCGVTGACIPKALPAYEGFVCVLQDGDQACPSGWGVPVTTHESAIDQRTCSDCTCTPDATCSGGSYRMYDRNDCNDNGSDKNIGNCTGLEDYTHDFDDTWSLRRTSEPTIAGSCTADGGVPGGAISVSGTSTLCCRP